MMTDSNWLLNLCVPTLRVADVNFNTSQILHILHDAGASSQQQLCLFPQFSAAAHVGSLFQPLLAQASCRRLKKIENALAGTN